MRASLPFSYLGSSGFSNGGGNLTSSLYLTTTPVSELEIVPKQYVDFKTSSINAVALNSGTMAKERFPSLTGDVTNTQGSGILVLKNSGVSESSYTKVTLDSKGVVASGSSLVSGDIPELDWSKVSSGKPTTLGGYNVSDCLNKIGGISTGFITSTAVITGNTHAVTKNFVDSVKAAVPSMVPVTGDIFTRTSLITPTGFLRCNGSEVSKTTYATLYAVIGDSYSVAEVPGNGMPWLSQYDINSTQNNSLSPWVSSGTLYEALYSSYAVVTKNRVYLLGGAVNYTAVNKIYTAVINSDGTLGAWSIYARTMPYNVSSVCSFVTKNRLYILGNGTINVHTCVINADGTLGAWSVASSLVDTNSQGAVAVIKNRVYLFGGNGSSGLSNKVYSATIDSNGIVGTWVDTNNPIPVALRLHTLAITKNKIHILGGASNKAYSCSINADGTLTGWTTSPNIPLVGSYGKAFVTKTQVYLLVANSNINYSAPINSDGTLGTWVTDSTLPYTYSSASIFVAYNNIYILGGFRGGTTIVNTIYKASISGGLNDYSLYYNGTITPTDPNNFKLPDYTSLETTVSKYYIKT